MRKQKPMFQKKKTQNTRQSVRVRRPAEGMNETFRRNNVVISKKQKEIVQRQKSVTQRQVEKKRSDAAQARKLKAIVLIAVCIGATLLFRSIISSVTISSNASTKLTASERSQYEQQILSRYKTHTIMGQSWLLDSSALTSDLRKDYPEIQRIAFSSSTPLHTTLSAEIRFRTPVFTWKDVGGKDQFVDQDGVLFSKNLDPAVNVNKLIKIEDQSGVVLEAGSSVLTANLVQFVGTLHSRLPTVYGENTKAERVIIPKSTREVQVQMSGSTYLIKFNSTRNLDEQIGELQSLLTFMKANNTTPSAYIDLRIPHKAFYK